MCGTSCCLFGGSIRQAAKIHLHSSFFGIRHPPNLPTRPQIVCCPQKRAGVFPLVSLFDLLCIVALVICRVVATSSTFVLLIFTRNVINRLNYYHWQGPMIALS